MSSKGISINGYLMLLATCHSRAEIIDVNAIGTGDYPTIQAAINAAVSGDEVVLHPGVYTGEGNRNLTFDGKAITVRSRFPNDSVTVRDTIIDCQSVGSGFYLWNSHEKQTSIIDGLTITHAATSGIHCRYSSPTIQRCRIIDNHATSHGGGVSCYGSAASISKCEILCNTSGTTTAFGGGVYLRNGAVVMRDCIIAHNTAPLMGGGIAFDRGDESWVVNCLIVENETWWHEGGGVLVQFQSRPFVRNCTIANNRISLKQDLDEEGGGLHCQGESVVTIRDCIIWGNEALNDKGNQISLWYSTVNLEYSNVPLGADDVIMVGSSTLNLGLGIIATDPRFAYGPLGAYYLEHGEPASPSVDGGSDLAATLGLNHLTTGAGESTDSGFVDVGFHYPISGCSFSHGDHDGDGLINLRDFAGLQRCYTGLAVPDLLPCCHMFDYIRDGDVDRSDLRSFLEAFVEQ